jgi:hypothetical protein
MISVFCRIKTVCVIIRSSYLQEDCSLDGYKNWQKRKAGPAPLTDVERELVAAHEEEAAVQERQKTANSLASQTLRGIAFPVDQEAQEKLGQLRHGTITYVQLVSYRQGSPNLPH